MGRIHGGAAGAASTQAGGAPAGAGAGTGTGGGGERKAPPLSIAPDSGDEFQGDLLRGHRRTPSDGVAWQRSKGKDSFK